MLDLSLDLAERAEWTPRELRHLDVHLDVSTFAFDTTSGLLAIGTQSGIVRLVGGPAVDIQLQNGSAIKSLQFAPSVFKLIVVGQSGRVARTTFTHSACFRCPESIARLGLGKCA
jgi:syntaxin-binding protein 5